VTPGTAAATLNVAGSDGIIYSNNLTGNGMAGGPEIYVNPNSLIMDMYAGTETDGSFIIGNRGDAELDFTIDGSTLPSWINLSPGNGVVANGDSTSINVHINATAVPAGNYSYLIEIISNDPTHASTSLMITVVITNAALLADFHADQLTGHPPLAVQFHDDSISDATAAWSSINSWNWDFENDGVFDSAEQNPLHTYSQPGMYSVRLVVGTDTGLTATKLRTGYIELVNSAPVIAVPYPLIPDMVEDTPWGPTNLSHVFSDPDSDTSGPFGKGICPSLSLCFTGWALHSAGC
jgi:PKD repeat protein